MSSRKSAEASSDELPTGTAFAPVASIIGTPSDATMMNRPWARGGLGLSVLRKSVEANSGSLRITAIEERYHFREIGSDSVERLPIAFPGTMILLKLSVKDDVVYTRKSEVVKR
jgi:hypothetical protein